MRYYVNFYDKELSRKEYKDLDINLVKIMDRWEERPPIYCTISDASEICELLNNNVKWDLYALYKSDKSKELIEKIIQRMFTTIADEEVKCIVNKDEYCLLIRFCSSNREYDVRELYNIVKKVLHINENDCRMINREYFFVSIV